MYAKRASTQNLVLLAAASLLLDVGAARAADAPQAEGGRRDNILEEIVVTGARKREESAQATPVAITAVNTEMLDRFQVTTVEGLGKLSPTMTIHKAYVAPDVASVYLRGFGTRSNLASIEPSVPFIIDGVYQPSVNSSMVDTFDLATVEILKGPQSTLVGKNSTVGALNITTLRPTGEFGGKVRLDYGRFDKLEARAAMDIPLGSTLAARVSLVRKSGGDWVTNLVEDKENQGGDDVTGGRLGVLFTPNDDVNWYLTGQYVVNKSPQQGMRSVSGVGTGEPWAPTALTCLVYQHCTPQKRRTNESGMTDEPESKNFDLTSNLDWDIGGVRFSSVTGYKHIDQDNNQDVDQYPDQILDVKADLSTNYFTQELRLANSQAGGLDLDGKLNWVTGLYYNSYRYNYTQPTWAVIPILPPQSFDTIQNNESYAAFGFGEYKFTDALSANLGVRYSRDKKKVKFTPAYVLDTRADLTTGLPVQFIYNDKTFEKTTFEGGPSFRIDENKLVFLRLATGYRGGGLNSVSPSPGNPAVYDPETVKSAEVGLKTEWLDNLLRVNVNVYYNEFKDLQKDVAKAVFNDAGEQTGYVQLLANAAEAETKGVEVEAIAVPTDALTLRLNLGYIDTEYSKFFADQSGLGVEEDLSDSWFSFTPKYTVFAAFDWVVSNGSIGRFTFGADYDWRDKQLITAVDSPNAHEGSYGLVNAHLRFDDPQDRYYITLYGNNLADEKYRAAWEPASGLATGQLDSYPRSYGITVGMSF